MPMLVAGLVLLWLSSILLRGFVRANPVVLSRHIRRGGGWLALVVALVMMVRGQFNLAFAAAGFGFWLMGTRPGAIMSQFAPAWGGKRPRMGDAPGVSRVRTDAIEMMLDQRTGRMWGWIVGGPSAGRALDEMSQPDCVAFHRWCYGSDVQGARLLETYLDRRFPTWRAAGDAGDGAGRAQTGFRRNGSAQMSEREAYEILGLAQGAGREEITRAHRRLMKEFHPDHGGATDVAARVNEAKDVLMSRHP